jgi:hypothetical protein
MHEVSLFGWGILSTPDLHSRWAMWREGRELLVAMPRRELIVGPVSRRVFALHVSLRGWGFRVGRMEAGGWGICVGQVAISHV